MTLIFCLLPALVMFPHLPNFTEGIRVQSCDTRGDAWAAKTVPKK